jgi:ABC-type Mn2+/Zn2+ transport system ATPase subunit
MQAPEVVIRATKLALGYDRRPVLQDVDLEVRREQFWFFVGPNGTGKSTLLRALLRQMRPLRGALWLSPELAAPEKIGFVPQRCDLNRALPTTVREFVRLGLVGIRCSATDGRDRLTAALAELGLGGMEGRSYWSLSGGQRQRALLARALIRQPTLLILDEPTNGLDLASEQAVLRFLQHLNRERHRTILFVTHELSLASRYGSNVALLHDGTVEAGPREALLTEERLRRAYGVSVRITGAGTEAASVRPASERSP